MIKTHHILTMIVLLGLWAALALYQAERQHQKAQSLQLMTTACLVELNGQTCQYLSDFGVSVAMFQNDPKYQAAINDKVARAAIRKEYGAVNDLAGFTHEFAEENGINLPDDYTERWPQSGQEQQGG